MTMREDPTTVRIRANGVQLALHEWPGPDPAIFFVHATGFHGRCWEAVVEALPQRHCLAVDARGHGRSQTPPPPYAWSTLGTDVAELVQAIGLRGAIGVGHSMGGHLVVQAAAQLPGAWTALLLIEPVIFPHGRYGQGEQKEHFTARRRNRWSSSQEMVERFADRPPFSSWCPRVLDDYATHGLQPAPDGDGYVLACPPAVEASIYSASTHSDADIYDQLGRIDIPVWVIRAGHPQRPGSFDMRASPTAPELAACFPQGKDEYLPDYSHFLPMEDPTLVAKRITTLVDQIQP